MIKCSVCNRKNVKRRIVKEYPLKDISAELPEHLKSITKEYVCINVISRLFGSTKWVESICNNRILRVLKTKA